MTAFRLYEPHELGRDGYPPEWHATVKHAVREEAGHRCVRCRHPYERGTGRYSPCDERCAHVGQPGRLVALEDGAIRGVMLSWPEPGDTSGRAVERHKYALDLLARFGGERQVEAEWRILTVHHRDGVKANCRWWNLAALCQRCHLQVQGKVRMERTWPWEHTEWFKPYVAGFYAFTYLGEDLSRAQVEARLDELLALEQMTAEDASGREWR